MKTLFFAATALLAVTFCSAQDSKTNKAQTIALLNKKAREVIDIIKVDNAKTRYEIQDAGFTASEMGVSTKIKIASDKYYTTVWTNDFNPAHISSIENVDMPKESPVGVIRINLKNPLAYQTSQTKQEGTTHTYVDQLHLNYLKVDPANFDEIKKALYRLKDIFTVDPAAPATEFTRIMQKNKPFWIASEGTSKTFKLSNVDVSNCSMRLYYHLSNVTKSGTTDSYHMMVIPLSAIDDIIMNESKSRPNTIQLNGGKKGFDLYTYKSGKYILSGADNNIPLFIDVSEPETYKEVVEILKKVVRGCGGGRLKG